MNKNRIIRQIFWMIVAIALFVAVKIGTAKVREHFKSKRDGLARELTGLPVFDRKAELKAIKDALQIPEQDYHRVSKPYQTIITEAEKAAREETDRKFNPEAYKKEFSAQQALLKAADYGQPVTFKYKDSAGAIKTVTGTYESSTSTEIFVSGKIISKRRILKNYRQLFDRGLSIKLMADHSIKFKKEYAKQKQAYYAELKKKLALDSLEKEGYLDFEGKIMTPKQISELLLSRAEKGIKVSRSELVRKLRNKYKPFDYFSYDIKFPEADDTGKDNPKPKTE